MLKRKKDFRETAIIHQLSIDPAPIEPYKIDGVTLTGGKIEFKKIRK